MMAEGRFKVAVSPFGRANATQVSDEQRVLWILRLAGRLVAQKNLDGAFDFIGSIDNSEAALRDAVLWFAAAQATQSGEASAVWTIGQRAAWSATEVVSIYGGLIEALKVPAPAQAAAVN